MSYDSNDFDTAGQGFATTGYDEDGNEVLGAIPFGAMRGRAALPAPAQQGLRRFPSPAQMRPVAPSRQQTAAALMQGITEPQARQIVREELSQFRSQNGLVPWQGMPTRATPRDEAMWPLGLGVLTFDSTTGVNLQLQVQPQRPFRGERLVLDVRRIGASAAAPSVVISDLRVGDVPQRIGGGFLPADIFRPDAFGVRLSLDASVPGVLITVAFQLLGPALAVGDSIIIAGGIIGRATESGDR